MKTVNNICAIITIIDANAVGQAAAENAPPRNPAERPAMQDALDIFEEAKC